jgi:hypothetical protein
MLSKPSPQRPHVFNPPVMLSPWNYGRTAYPAVPADGEDILEMEMTASQIDNIKLLSTLSNMRHTVLHSCVMPDAFLHSTSYFIQFVTDTL